MAKQTFPYTGGRKRRPTTSEVYAKHSQQFREMFGVRLSQFWDSAHGGFLLRDFCTQVLEYHGEDPGAATTELFGREGRTVIRHLLHDTRLMW